MNISDDAPLTSDVGEVLSADEIGSILNDEEISEGARVSQRSDDIYAQLRFILNR